MTMNQYEPAYIYRKKDQPEFRIPFQVGQIIEVGEAEHFRFLKTGQVPDRDHQSSLDYLKGV